MSCPRIVREARRCTRSCWRRRARYVNSSWRVHQWTKSSRWLQFPAARSRHDATILSSMKPYIAYAGFILGLMVACSGLEPQASSTTSDAAVSAAGSSADASLAAVSIDAGSCIPDDASVDAGDSGPCCRICRAGKACGDTCIARDRECHVGPGCACNQ